MRVYGHLLNPPSADGTDHVHTCPVCHDDEPCPVPWSQCGRYLGALVDPSACATCTPRLVPERRCS